MMRDKDQLSPLQYALLQATERLRASGIPEIHPYGLTTMLEDAEGDRRWIGYGSQYRAASQLTERGFLSTRWEDPSIAEAEKRPRRRLYAITQSGRRALATAPGGPGGPAAYFEARCHMIPEVFLALCAVAGASLLKLAVSAGLLPFSQVLSKAMLWLLTQPPTFTRKATHQPKSRSTSCGIG